MSYETKAKDSTASTQGRRERPITLRAMLAADCSELPIRLRHLIHVMALHAANATGVGLTGQEMLADYVGCGDRHIRTMLTELDAEWEAGRSPVRIVREKRFQNSDRYTIEVREGAPLKRPRRIPRSGQERIPRSGSAGSPDPHDRAPGSAAAPSEADLEARQSTEVALQSNPQRKEKTTKPRSDAGPEGPRGAETTNDRVAAARQRGQITLIRRVLLAQTEGVTREALVSLLDAQHPGASRVLDAALREFAPALVITGTGAAAKLRLIESKIPVEIQPRAPLSAA